MNILRYTLRVQAGERTARVDIRANGLLLGEPDVVADLVASDTMIALHRLESGLAVAPGISHSDIRRMASALTAARAKAIEWLGNRMELDIEDRDWTAEADWE